MFRNGMHVCHAPKKMFAFNMRNVSFLSLRTTSHIFLNPNSSPARTVPVLIATSVDKSNMRAKAAFAIVGLARRQLTVVKPCLNHFLSSPVNPVNDDLMNDDFEDSEDDDFLLQQLARMEAMEDEDAEYFFDEDDNFADLFDIDNFPEDEDLIQVEKLRGLPIQSSKDLERALLQGVVPAGAGVGSQCLPGDWDFDPLDLSTKDFIGRAQRAIWDMNPGGPGEGDVGANVTVLTSSDRPSALIIRDYREAEIRHGRLAMLASLFWPLQEMLDRLLLDESQFGSLVYSSGVTLPYIPLLMTAIMLLLGYLDVYSQSVKAVDKIGEAFLPGDCFWDPLSILEGAPATMKRNMQEREIFNGRMAMLAVAAFFWEELMTHKPLISIESNALLFEPAYQVPFIQQWLDSQFSPVFTITPEEVANVADVVSSLDLGQ